MYGHIQPNAVPSPQMGSEHLVFFTPSPGLAPSPNLYAAPAPIAPTPMQFPAQPPPQVTGISPSASYGCGPVIGLQVPMWAHIPQTPQAAVIGNMMPYPTQPLQYQPCFVPPVQPSNHGMYFNNQVQSYSLMPQPYIPVPTNRGFRQPAGMRQPSNMPYIMQQDYMPVTPPMGSTGIAPPQPPQTHPRPPVYELSCVQQAQQYAPQCSKPPKYFSAFVQKRSGILSQEAYYQHSETNLGHINTCDEKETPRLPAKSDEQCGNPDVHPLQEEQSAEVNKQIIDANSLSISPVERGPTPDPVLLLGNSESPEPIPTRSPSETTLVPSPPSSDDGRETVCNSPLSLSDCEEEAKLTATEDDNIPTKDTSGACSSIQKLEPEQPYDNEIIKESSDSLSQEHHSFSKPRVQTMSSPSFLIKGADVAALHPSVTSSANICSSNTPERHTINAKPIRSHIDTPMYNAGHSRVLCQLSHATGTSRQCNRATKRPLTTHFRQLFKPIPYNDKEEENDVLAGGEDYICDSKLLKLPGVKPRFLQRYACAYHVYKWLRPWLPNIDTRRTKCFVHITVWSLHDQDL